MKKILVFGFTGYSSYDENPSELIVSKLKGELHSNKRLVYKIFDVSYKYVDDSINKLFNTKEYLGAIGFGLHPNDDRIRVENTFYNNVSTTLVDNDCFTPYSSKIKEYGLPEYYSQFKFKDVVDLKYCNTLSPISSNQPGDYLCNYTCYMISNKISNNHTAPVVFVHIPLTSENEEIFTCCKSITNNVTKILESHV